MNWKKLLQVDIAHPIRSWRALHDLRREPPPLPGEEPDQLAAETERLRHRHWGRRSRPKWLGPRYFRRNRWRKDLITVTEQLASIVRTNAPMAKGLEVAAVEEFTSRPRIILSAVLYLYAAISIGFLIACAVLPPFQRLLTHNELLNLLFAILFALLLGWVILRAWSLRVSPLCAVLLALSDRIAWGSTLSEAMRSLPRFFPAFHADLVEAGEASGQVAESLEALNEETLNRLDAAQAIQGNLAYLGTVIVVQFTLVMFLMLKVIPVIVQVYGEFGAALPKATRMLIHTSALVRQPGFLMQAGIGAVVVLVLWWLMRHDFSRKMGRRGWTTRPLGWVLFLFRPLRNLVVQHNLYLASRLLGLLLRAGVPLDDALEKTAKAGLHPAYQKQFSRIRARVLQGETLLNACNKNRFFPPIPDTVLSLVALGEQSGMLPDALGTIERNYEMALNRNLRILADVFMPAAVCALGALTLVVLIGLYTPIFSLADVLTSQM